MADSNHGDNWDLNLTDDLAMLRPMSLKYAREILIWRSSERAKYLHEGAKSLSEQREWMRNRPTSELNFMILCVCEQLVGMVSLIGVDQVEGVAEPARFFIRQEYSACGFAVVAMHQLYELAFRTLSLELLVGGIAEQNVKMLRWHQHFGMVESGQSESKEDVRGLGRTLVTIELTSARYFSFTLPKMSAYVEQLRSRKPPNRCLCSGTAVPATPAEGAPHLQ